MRYAVVLLALFIYALGVLYLSQPGPDLPTLANSKISDEPGDTWQNPDQIAFYTDKSRAEVIAEISDQYKIQIFGWTVPSYRLNYPPEESYRLVRDQVPSYYLEEIVYPFHSSLFINGWEPTNHPRFGHLAPEDRPVVTYKEDVYLSKVTLRPVNSPFWARLLVWTLVFPGAYLAYLSVKKVLS
jgi:hypothetical protein